MHELTDGPWEAKSLVRFETMLQQVRPYIRCLAEQPDREDILAQVTDNCFSLFHSLQGGDAWAAGQEVQTLIDGWEYQLDRVRSGTALLRPDLIALLEESCAFLAQVLVLIRTGGMDERCRQIAEELSLTLWMATGTRVAFEDHASGMDPETWEAFVEEAGDLLTAAEQEFVLWDFIALDSERVAALGRLVQRLKRNFTLYDCRTPAQLCAALESTLRRYVQGEYFQTEYPERIFLRAIDTIRQFMAQFPVLNESVAWELEQHLTAIQGMMRQPIGELLVEAGLVAPEILDQALALQRACRDQLQPPRRLGEVLVAMGEVTQEQLDQALQQQHARQGHLAEVERHAINKEPTGAAFSQESANRPTCQIESRHLAQLHQLVEQSLALSPASGQRDLLVQMRSIIQHCRGAALAALTSQVRRMVHEFSVRFDKRAQCSIDGAEILENLWSEPSFVQALCQLIRNGVEHGLEDKEQRELLGKGRTGKIGLLALRRGGEIWISVEDDGGGFDFAKIRQHLVHERQVPANSADQLSNREVLQLLLTQPGAVDGATEPTSGLAFVQYLAQSMQGTLHVTTRPHRGTCISLHLPTNHWAVDQKNET